MSPTLGRLAELHGLLDRAAPAGAAAAGARGELDAACRRLEAALEGAEGDTDVAFRATLALFQQEVDRRRAESRGLRKDAARASARAEAAEHAAERRWRLKHEQALAVLAAEREAAGEARREAGALREALAEARRGAEGERAAAERVGARAAALARALERRETEAAEAAADVGRQAAREAEWRAAACRWLKSELRASADLEAAPPPPAASPVRRGRTATRASSNCRACSAPCREPGACAAARPASARWRQDVAAAVAGFDAHSRKLRRALARLEPAGGDR
jgi:hypothetical protein